VRVATLTQQVAQELGLRIVRGDYLPGDALPSEADLSAELEVSRTVVREGLKVLAAKGLIRSRPRVGPVVQPRRTWEGLDSDIIAWSTQDGEQLRTFLDQLTEVRHIIEPDAARLAATRATPEELEQVAATFAAMEDAVADPGAFMTHDLAFHEAIIQASHNDLLVGLLTTLRKGLAASRQVSTGTLRQDTPETARARETALALHRAVVDSLRERDGDRAHEAMVDLLSTVHEAIGLMLEHEHSADTARSA
jgi:GntR family transcriptional regulator, galactonate operon transcriptional repressor